MQEKPIPDLKPEEQPVKYLSPDVAAPFFAAVLMGCNMPVKFPEEELPGNDELCLATRPSFKLNPWPFIPLTKTLRSHAEDLAGTPEPSHLQDSFQPNREATNRPLCNTENHQLPTYCTWNLDPLAFHQDAMTLEWTGITAYAFPPIALIPWVLLKFEKSPRCRMILIAPHWLHQMWFPRFC